MVVGDHLPIEFFFRASGILSDAAIAIEHDSDDEETIQRSRPIAVQFMFWFCGILIVLLGVGALVYAIYLVSSKFCNKKEFTHISLLHEFRRFQRQWIS